MGRVTLMHRTLSLRHVRALIAITTALTGAGVFAAPAPAAGAVPRLVTAIDHVLFSFAGKPCAGPLYGVIAGPGGVLYGTTDFGGSHDDGCVFSLAPGGSGYTQRVLFKFNGPDGAKPQGIVADAHGDLFGDTLVGGTSNAGAVFELVPGGSGSYTEKVLHSFTGGSDGLQPVGIPVLDAQGDLFGVTQFGGTGGQGVVYEMRRTAAGFTEKVLHPFARTGGLPQAGLAIASDGTLFGTIYGFGQGNPDGTVFRIQRGTAGPVYTPLYNFKGGTDGANPFGALTVDNRTGVIYGTTQHGGAASGIGSGTVFSLTPHGSGYTEQVLHGLAASGAEGFGPQGTLLLTANGDLLGTATLGGTRCSGIGCGTLFELAPSGTSFSFRIIHLFTGPPDGADPEWSGVIPGPHGTLFGTTRSGGTARACGDGGPGGVLGCGTVYQLAP
jgi:uncharacterized repeat protein (TIGR03803 family)